MPQPQSTKPPIHMPSCTSTLNLPLAATTENYGSITHPTQDNNNNNNNNENDDDGINTLCCHPLLNSNAANSIDGKHQHKVYFQRWIVLFVFSLLSFLNNWIWITWSPLTPQAARYWGVTTARVDDLSAVFMYVYIPLSFPALQFLSVYKLRVGLLLGGVWNLMGAAVRYAGMSSYEYIYAGTVLCAMCQTLTLAMPPLISTLWFPDHERGLSTSLGVLANMLGSVLGLGITIFVRFTTTASPDALQVQAHDVGGYADTTETVTPFLDSHQLKWYLRSQLIWSAIAFILIVCLVQSDKPPSPPSEAAAGRSQYRQPQPQDIFGQGDNNKDSPALLQTTVSYWGSIRLFLSTPSGSMLCVVYGLAVGVLYALATFLGQFFSTATTNGLDAGLKSSPWSETEIGYLGVDLMLAGLVGSLVSGDYLDRSSKQQHQSQAQPHRFTSIVLVVGALISMGLFALSRNVWPYDRFLAYLATGLLGCFLVGFISVGFEYGTAIAYPADEAAVAGVMNVAAQIGGWILVAIGGQMMATTTTGTASDGDSTGADHEHRTMMSKFSTVLIGTLLLALVLLSNTVKAKSQRPQSVKEGEVR